MKILAIMALILVVIGFSIVVYDNYRESGSVISAISETLNDLSEIGLWVFGLVVIVSTVVNLLSFIF